MAFALASIATLAERLVRRATVDGEFGLYARYWSGSIAIDIGDKRLAFLLDDGQIDVAHPGAASGPGHIGLAAPRDVWEKILAPVPQPFFNDIMPARAAGVVLTGEDETIWQYYPAVRRLVDLVREEWNNDGSH